jgi:hypothetical protein
MLTDDRPRPHNMIGVQGMITVKTNKAGETEHEIGAFLPSRTGATFQGAAIDTW